MKRRLGALALVCFAWAGVVFYLHRERVGGLRREGIPRILEATDSAVPAGLLRHVGFFDNRQKSSFLHFRREKPDGVRRLCALGDSFTQGAEVDASHDYPSLLHERLERSAPGRYEVLNFGQGWFGFHQTFLVWEELARSYGCDVVLLGPGTFYPERDTSFQHAGDVNPYYLHARYVLDGDGVRLVEVVGDTVEERFEEYQRLVPHWRYLRYDDVAPAAMRALLPSGWTADNPFYYRGDKAEEAREIHRRLLRELAEEAPAVILGHSLAVTTLAPRVDGFSTFHPLRPRSFPYRAAGDHFGPLGNDLVARQYEAAVTRKSGAWLPVLRTLDLQERPPLGASEPRPLSQYDSIDVEIDGVAVGSFVTGRSRSDRRGSSRTLAEKSVSGLVLVATPGTMPVTGSDSVLDGCFLPTTRSPVDGAPVVLVSKGERTRIGQVRLWHPDLAIGDVVLDEGFERRRLELAAIDDVVLDEGVERRRLELAAIDDDGVFRLPEPDGDADAVRGGEAKPVTLEIADEPILAGVLTDLRSVRGPCFLLRANGSGLVRLEEAARSRGPVEIAARRGGAPDVRAEVARWEVERLASPR